MDIFLAIIAVIINSLIYLFIIIKRKREEPKFKVIESKMLFTGGLFAIFAYVILGIAIFTKSYTIAFVSAFAFVALCEIVYRKCYTKKLCKSEGKTHTCL